MAATILVVDDDWMNREMLQAHLEYAGLRVLLAHNGPKALEIAASDPPDIVLLDVRMPGMDGYEVCAALKSSPKTQHIPVLLTTAMEDEESKSRGIEAGADDFVSKPFEVDQMLAQIQRFLN
jgi:CheY-like chemotaxis protein